MTKLPSKLVLVTAVAVLSSSYAYSANSIAEAFENGETSLSFRMRYEDVDDDAVAADADALTLKSRLTYSTASYNDVTALIEVDNVLALGDVDYNDGLNGMADKTKIIDPEDTDVNQVYLAFTGLDGALVKLGRQRILLDNQRFVGGVGFRQNEQTYDALSVEYKGLDKTKIFYAYVDAVQGITGKDSKQDTHLLNVKYDGLALGSLSGYYYNFVEDKAGGYDLDTFGVRFNGVTDSGSSKLLYTAEYASQDNGTSEPAYYLLEGGVKFAGVTAKLGHEVLGSDEGIGFNTPLATKHKFQGWADQFLGTPGEGIEDTYISIGTKLAGVKLLAVYHDYETEESGTDLGSEWGLVVAKKLSKNYGLSLKYADYSASDESGKADKAKLWLTGTAKF